MAYQTSHRARAIGIFRTTNIQMNVVNSIGGS